MSTFLFYVENGIRCILTAAVEANVSHDKDSIPYHVKLPAVDHENYSLEPFFDQAADYIDQHLRITNVLVHCMAGVSRSVSLVMAYLMKYRSMTL
jgi:protein-tyrosine phosphatase